MSTNILQSLYPIIYVFFYSQKFSQDTRSKVNGASSRELKVTRSLLDGWVREDDILLFY
jgi:hypothetical protein